MAASQSTQPVAGQPLFGEIVQLEAIQIDGSATDFTQGDIVELADLQAVRVTLDFVESIQSVGGPIYARWRVEDPQGNPITAYGEGGWNPRFQGIPMRRVADLTDGGGWLRTISIPFLTESNGQLVPGLVPGACEVRLQFGTDAGPFMNEQQASEWALGEISFGVLAERTRPELRLIGDDLGSGLLAGQSAELLVMLPMQVQSMTQYWIESIGPGGIEFAPGSRTVSLEMAPGFLAGFSAVEVVGHGPGILKLRSEPGGASLATLAYHVSLVPGIDALQAFSNSAPPSPPDFVGDPFVDVVEVDQVKWLRDFRCRHASAADPLPEHYTKCTKCLPAAENLVPPACTVGGPVGIYHPAVCYPDTWFCRYKAQPITLDAYAYQFDQVVTIDCGTGQSWGGAIGFQAGGPGLQGGAQLSYTSGAVNLVMRCCQYKALLNADDEMYQVPISVLDCHEAQFLLGPAPK